MQAPVEEALYLAPVTDPLADPGAGVQMLNSIRDELQTGPGGAEMLWLLAGIVGVLGLLLVVARLAHPPQKDRVQRSWGFFRAALMASGLSERMRRDVEQLARLAEVDPPTAVLLSPGCFSRALGLIPAATSRAQRRRFAAAGEALFGALLPAERGVVGSSDGGFNEGETTYAEEVGVDPLRALRSDPDELI